MFQSFAGHVKESGTDRRGRWSFQVFDSGSDFKSVIFSIYRCNKTSLKDSKKKAYRQQKILQAKLGYRGDPTRYFKADLISAIKQLQSKYGRNLRPYILGDFNHCPNIQQVIDDLCHEFQLVDIFSYLYPHSPDFKTYCRGSRRIDCGLIPVITAKK